MSEYNINQQWTLLERAKRSPDGKRAMPALDVMDKIGVDSFLKDVPFFPANQGLKHQITRTTSRPSSTIRNMYAGVKKTSTATQVIHEPVCLFEQRSEVDEAHIDTLENGDEARAMIDKPHAAGILDDFVYEMFRGVRSSGEEHIDGFLGRLNTLSYPGHTTTTVPYVWNNGGSTTLSSLYIVEYGPQAVHGLYPGAGAVRGGGPFGMSIINKGKERLDDPTDSTKKYYGYVTQFCFYFGLAVWNDWKIARIANISIDETSAYALNDNLVIKALNHGKFNKAATRIYANPYLTTQIDIRAKDKGNTIWDTSEVFGKEISQIQGIPLRKLDESILSANETAVA